MLTFLVIVIVICLVLNAVQMAWNIKVKAKCKCGAAAGRWIRWYDEPVSMGARWYAARQNPRRWGDADFAKFSKLGRAEAQLRREERYEPK